MLVLSRKPGQVIRLGNDVKITILAVAGNKVRIGIDAPDSVPIWREECDGQDKSQTDDCRQAPGPNRSRADLAMC